MKLVICGDTHIGLRNDSPIFDNLARKFYSDVLFPYLENNKIDTMIQLGDLFDRRKYINFSSLYNAKQYLFDPLCNLGVNFHTILGNHDIYYKNTLGISSPTLLLGEYDNVIIHRSPTTLQFGSLSIDLIPWICEENHKEAMTMISTSSSPWLLAHLELSGFEMDRGNFCHEGQDAGLFSRYEQVISGHFHHKSKKGNILYAGVPFEMSWSDWNDPKGFYVLDTETRGLEFIENPHTIYVKIPYNDDTLYFDDVQNHDYSAYTGKYVKVVVEKKSNAFLFETMVDNIKLADPVDVGIVEDFTETSESEVSESDVDQADDTMTIIEKAVDGIEIELQKPKLKLLFREIYEEAVSSGEAS